MSRIVHHNGAYGWKYNYLGAAAQTPALLIGHGTSAEPATTATAATNFAQFYTANSAATGTSRGLYWNHTVKTSGESGRFYSAINGAANDVHGLHATAEVISGGTVTGEAAGVRGNFMLPAGVTGGQVAGVYGELYANTATSDVSNGSCFRAVIAGDPTGLALLDDHAALIAIDGGTIGSGNLVAAVSDHVATHGIRCKVNGVAMYLLATTTLA